jgi:hypothetical protein
MTDVQVVLLLVVKNSEAGNIQGSARQAVCGLRYWAALHTSPTTQRGLHSLADLQLQQSTARLSTHIWYNNHTYNKQATNMNGTCSALSCAHARTPDPSNNTSYATPASVNTKSQARSQSNSGQ